MDIRRGAPQFIVEKIHRHLQPFLHFTDWYPVRVGFLYALFCKPLIDISESLARCRGTILVLT